jgi:hypothetical protein
MQCQYKAAEGTFPRIWSLLEIMRDFDAWGIAMLLHHIHENRDQLSISCAQGLRDTPMPEKEVELYLSPILSMAKSHADEVDLQSVLDRVWDNGAFTMLAHSGITYQQACNELIFLKQCVEADLQKCTFTYISADRVKFVKEQKESWIPIGLIFKDSKTDTDEAIFCYALERYTATVFHSMRIAEHGLRYLARKVKVRLSHKGNFQPIEYADWQKVIDGIKIKIAKAVALVPGPKRQAKLEQYSDAADHCLFMKDIWRNTISHARKPYKGPEALAAFQRVRDFMQFLATNF